MLKDLLRLMRPAHWVKNVFVLAPMLFAGLLTDVEAIESVLIALLCFCAAASAIYAFNDLRDRAEDRNHPVKRDRPVASGRVTVGAAAGLALALAVGATALASLLGPTFVTLLLAYLVLNLLYTIWFKHIVILDVMSVAAGFVIRVAAGAAAIPVAITAWLLLCTIFLALFLAFSKRRHEVHMLEEAASSQRKVLDHYGPTFLDQMINVVTASTVVAYALYSVSPGIADRFGYNFLAATIPFVLYGIFRYLYLTYQRPGELNPTEAVVRDAPSVINVALWCAAVVVILYLS